MLGKMFGFLWNTEINLGTTVEYREKYYSSESEFMYTEKEQATFEYRLGSYVFWMENQGGLPVREDMGRSSKDIQDLDMRLLGRINVLGHFTI